MSRVIEFLISLLIVAALFVLVGLFLPSKRSFNYSVETNRPMATVYDLFNGFSRFRDWNPMVRYDPRMESNLSGPEMGVGAKFNFHSRDAVVGSGSWEIVDSVPGEMIRYRLVNDARGADKTMTVRFERTGQMNHNVKITQEYRVNYGFDLLGRYAGLYVTRNVGDDIKRGLDKFSSLLATIPKFDYTQHPNPFSMVDLPAQDVLLVSTATKRSNDLIAIAMENQVSWISKVMAANGLVADGPLRIVTNEFTADSFGFDVLQPVRRSSTPAGTPAGERMSLLLEGPVNYDQIAARKVATTDFTGPSPGLARVRDMVRAWSITHGHDTTDRPYDEYLGGVSTMLDEDAKFKVYWPVK
jgi:uncharacterized membrane protein